MKPLDVTDQRLSLITALAPHAAAIYAAANAGLISILAPSPSTPAADLAAACRPLAHRAIVVVIDDIQWVGPACWPCAPILPMWTRRAFVHVSTARVAHAPIALLDILGRRRVVLIETTAEHHNKWMSHFRPYTQTTLLNAARSVHA